MPQNGMERVHRYRNILLNSQNFNRQEKQWIKENISIDFLKFIIEICANILDGNLVLDKKCNTCLKPYIKIMRAMVEPHKTLNQKKGIIQSGGALPILLKVVGTALIQHLLQNDN